MTKKRILIIDDEIGFTGMVKINLEATGHYEVRIENHSPIAVQTAREFRPELILLDFIMPEMDGGDVAAKLKEDPLLQSIPIVMVTALVSNKEMGPDGTFVSGGQLMMAKPISLPNLLHCLKAQLA